MKKILFSTLLLSFIHIFAYTQSTLKDTVYLNETIIESFTPFQANLLTPITYKNVDKSFIHNENYGQEPSKIIGLTPSISTYSESGGNWGYSYIRLRGVDQTRINVTLNGIPMNEPEDQGCYFSNYPDFLQSVDGIQIQRGVGMTKNGYDQKWFS